ncbi:MAG: hypothetical protein EXR75_12590 [Myxococcales bacterium]|nr:hypothetical protein [Myxococcales bacterium]
MTRHRSATMLAVLGLAAGCERPVPTITSVELVQVTTPPLEVVLSQNGISLPQGIAVVAAVTVFVDTEEDAADFTHLIISFPTLVDFVPMHTPSSEFMLIGRTVGEGKADIRYSASEYSLSAPFTIPLTVVPQP